MFRKRLLPGLLLALAAACGGEAGNEPNSECEVGRVGCPCAPGAQCDSGALCGPGNLCEVSTCTPGTESCVCTSAGQCGGGLFCSRNRCVVASSDCTPGEIDCECVGGSCGPGLICVDGQVCADATGQLGGACFSDGTCFEGNRCENSACVPCRPGTQACICDSGETCAEGLECSNARCVSSSGLATSVPTNDACRTPCQGDIVDAQGVRVCQDGFVEGCAGPSECVEGQCVAPDNLPRTCNLDIDCPAFQMCSNGTCRSNCTSDVECVSGASCENGVCRKACSLGDDSCPADHSCNIIDGDVGYCLQTDTAVPSPSPEVPPGFSLSAQILPLSSVVPGGFITITNDGAFEAAFRITKATLRETVAAGQTRTTALGNVSHEVKADLNSCTAGTLGCRCGGSAQDFCGDLESGVTMACEAGICRPPTCSDTNAIGCICEGTDCRTYCDAVTCPMNWVDLSVSGPAGEIVSATPKTAVDVTIPGGESVTLTVDKADGRDLESWQGVVEITDTRDGSSAELVLSYANQPDGAWSGDIIYFGDFRVNETGLETWISSGHTAGENLLGNAFLQAWSRFRNGALSTDRFSALLTATRTESWRSPNLQERCPGNAICFPFLNADGFDIYTTQPLTEAVPAGVVELPFGMNIRQVEGGTFEGKVVSELSLQYPGDPALNLSFAGDPSGCSVESPDGCLLFVDQFDFSSVVGGRHDEGTCGPRFETQTVPWFVEGFLATAQLNTATGQFERTSCRDTGGPLTPNSAPALQANASLSGANPVPDGQIRERELQLIDGALIDNQIMIILFRERVASWIPGTPDLWAYGYITMAKSDTNLADEAFVGGVPTPANDEVIEAGPSCDADLLSQFRLNANSSPVDIASAMLDGVRRNTLGPDREIFPVNRVTGNQEVLHYLCVETGEFNGGSGGLVRNDCPAGSDVRFFTTDINVVTLADLDGHPCQANGSCDRTLNDLIGLGRVVQLDPYFRCEDTNRVFCSDDRSNLRVGKRFFSPAANETVLPSLRTAVDEGFRFRTRFQDRDGRSLGFTPIPCDGQLIPYCFDAPGIEEVQERVDCLFSTFVDQRAALLSGDASLFFDVRDFLRESFAFGGETDPVTNATINFSGFETLNAELLIMLGDEDFTRAVSSRFELAGQSNGDFPGALLEPGGINLSGVVGAEMRSLYAAIQYYDLVLDRFFRHLELIERSLENPADGIVDQRSVTTYFERVIRASSQKSRVASEIANRYQNLNRPDLSRLVIQRSYVGAYLESLILTHLMQNLLESAEPEDVDQVAASIRTAQITYRVGMSEMRARFDALNTEVNFFGLEPDFIPFPAVEIQVGRDTGFEVISNRARELITIARTDEDVAINTTREFETDANQFQTELRNVELNFESQLSDICGSFTAQSGQILPAIRKHQDQIQNPPNFDDPCGNLGTGEIHRARGEVDIALARVQQMRQQIENVIREAEIEEDRIDAICDRKDSFEDTFFDARNDADSLQTRIDTLQTVISGLDRASGLAQSAAQVDPMNVTAGVIGIGAGTALNIASVGIEAKVNTLQREIREAQRKEATIIHDFCSDDPNEQNNRNLSLAQIDANARILTINLRVSELELEALQAQFQLDLALSEVQRLRDRGRRLESELDEMLQLTINREAARNNPNFRVFKNSAVLKADATFEAALREVFKATLVFEYHTSQSFAGKEALFLSRMAARGDFNLENYLIGLNEAFRAFEDTVGVRDQRLLRLSLRDDILQIPVLNEVGEPLSQAERFRLFREQLTSGALINEEGYITAPFALDFDFLSPRTANHKVISVETELVGSGLGDQFARVYLTMAGTSAIRGLDGETDFFSFDPRFASSSSFLNGSKPFDANIYKTARFAERPLVNSRWELQINLIDEPDNDDLALDGLTDIFVYFFHSDFSL